MLRTVFGPPYVAMAAAIAGGMIFGLLLLSEYIFLEPYLTGHVPRGTEAGFVLILAISMLSGLVIPMNVYRIRILRQTRTKMGGGVVGSFIGAAAGACSCGPAGFAIISTFGSVGSAAATFLTNYEIPIRLVALALLVVTVYTTSRSLKMECRIGQ